MSETLNAQAPTPGLTSIRVCMLGGRAAGKTCLMAGFAILSEPDRQSSVHVRGLDEATISRLDELGSTLRAQEWPAPTNKPQLLKLRIEFDCDAINLVTLDYKGDSFVEELRRLRADEIEELYASYINADAHLLLLDPLLDLTPPDGADATLRQAVLIRIQALVDAVGDIYHERKGRSTWRTSRKVDLGVILTKSDQHPEIDSVEAARAFCERRAGPLLEKLRRRSDELKIFPVSAVGASVTVEREGKLLTVPAEALSPYGYESVLQWLIDRHRWRKRRPARIATSVLAVTAVIFLLGTVVKSTTDRNRDHLILADPSVSLLDKIDKTKTRPWPTTEKQERMRSDLIRTEVQKLEQAVELAASEGEISDVRSELEKLAGCNPGVWADRIDKLKKTTGQKLEFILVQILKTTPPTSPAYVPLCRRILREFPAGRFTEEVEKKFNERLLARKKEDRDRVRAITVLSAAGLRSRGEATFEYLKQGHPDDPDEVPRIRRAAELVLRFSQPNQYRIVLKRTGGFLGPRHQKSRLLLNDAVVMDVWSQKEAKMITWDRQEATSIIQWQSGDTLRAEILAAHFVMGSSPVGYCEDRGPLALRLLGKKQSLHQVNSDWKSYVDEPFIQFDIDGISDFDWSCISDYILPGDRW